MSEQLPYFYETEVEWTGARKGEMRYGGQAGTRNPL
jgi:hypothetical protein